MVQPWKDGLQLKVSKLLRHSHNWKEWKWQQLEIVPKNLWSLLFVCTFPFTAQLDACLSGHGEVFGKITPILVQRWFVAFFCRNDLSPLFWRLYVTYQQPWLPSDQKFGVANCLPVSKVLNPKTWYWYKDSMRMRLKGFDQIKNKNYWGIYARFWSDYEKFSCENFKGADLSCDQGCARDGQELHLLNTTFTFLIFQARKMGKRRSGRWI